MARFLLVSTLSLIGVLASGCSGSAGRAPRRASSAPTASEPPTTAGQQASASCDPVKMLVLAGDWNGYAGGSAGIVIFSNAGHTACAFAGGYPEVKFLGASGQALAVASRDPIPSAKASFELPPGGAVGTKILMSDTSFQPKSRCDPQTATEILIGAPSGKLGTSVSGTFEVCTKMSSVGVEPVQDLPGLTGY